MSRHFVLLAACLCLAGAGNASIVFERSGDPGTVWALGGINQQQLATSWIQNTATGNTTVTIPVLQGYADPVTVHFDLRADALDGTDIGSGGFDVTLAANETRLGIDAFNLPSLGAGTYFLIASVPFASDASADASWQAVLFNGNLSEISDGGIATFGPEYIGTSGLFQAEELFLPFAVTTLNGGGGAGGDAPEPGTFALMGAGLVAVCVAIRRRRTSV